MGLCIARKMLLLMKCLHPETLESVLELVRKNTRKSLLNNKNLAQSIVKALFIDFGLGSTPYSKDRAAPKC